MATSTSGCRSEPVGADPAVWSVWVVVIVVGVLPLPWAMAGVAAPPWAWIAQVGIPVVLLGIAVAWSRLRRLLRFAVVMTTLLTLLHVWPWVDLSWQPLQQVFGDAAFDERMQGEQLSKLGVTGAMIIVMLLLGLRRRDFFLLTRGGASDSSGASESPGGCSWCSS